MGRGTTEINAEPVVIDCDPGVDDFLAIRLAFGSPELDVKALTVTGGNCPLRFGVRNALRAVEDSGNQHVPVHPGARRPTRGHFTGAEAWHGSTGLTGRLHLPDGSPSEVPAVEALRRMLQEHPAGSVTVVALGPLTNIAELIEAHSAIAKRIGALVVMGGAVDVPGNVTRHAEFNIWADPEAGRIVARSGLPVRLVGIDVCHDAALRSSDVETVKGNVGRVLRGWFKMRNPGDEMVPYDPVAVVAALNPRLFEWERTGIDVCFEGEQRGRTVRTAGGPQIEVAVGMDSPRVGQLFRDRVLA